MKHSQFHNRLQKKTDNVERALHVLLPPDDASPDPIHRAVRYSALGGGKRIRAVFVVETASLGDIARSPGLFGEAPFTSDDAPTLPESPPVDPGQSLHDNDVAPGAIRRVGAAHAVAAAIEMIHAYSLVHDDLPCMDDDDLRRGKPTNHQVFGEAIAVLAGDALLTRAFEVLAGLHWSGIQASTALNVIGTIARAAGATGLIGGQTADIQAERRTSSDDQSDDSALLTYIHLYKTAALIRASVRAGAFLAGLDRSLVDALDRYGKAVGLAFQITDDLLDVFGDAQRLGKATGQDEKLGKLTYPALHGVEQSQAMVEDQLALAKDSLKPFGQKARFLSQMADYVVRRDM